MLGICQASVLVDSFICDLRDLNESPRVGRKLAHLDLNKD